MSQPNDSDERKIAEKIDQKIEIVYNQKRVPLDGKECFVCYFDVDGFRERVFADPQKLFDEYSQMKKYITNSFFKGSVFATNNETKTIHYDKILEPYIFSDSWFFATIDTTEEALRQISSVAAGIFMRFFEINFVIIRKMAPRTEFESVSKPRQGFMIGHYTIGAHVII